MVEKLGMMKVESFDQKTVSILAIFRIENSSIFYMQDEAPCHLMARTIEELRWVGITSIEWPPFSTDLSPIENVWNMIKNSSIIITQSLT